MTEWCAACVTLTGTMPDGRCVRCGLAKIVTDLLSRLASMAGRTGPHTDYEAELQQLRARVAGNSPCPTCQKLTGTMTDGRCYFCGLVKAKPHHVPPPTTNVLAGAREWMAQVDKRLEDLESE